MLSRKPPNAVPTDTVVPLRFWDDKDYLRCFTVDFTYRFDDVLDVQKLQSALDRLMRIGDWGQLGARIRRKVCKIFSLILAGCNEEYSAAWSP